MLTEHRDKARERRGRALRLATVAAGLLQLAAAAILIGLPGGSPTLTLVPVPEDDAEPTPGRRPAAALSVRPTASPVPSTPPAEPDDRPAVPQSAPARSASPADTPGAVSGQSAAPRPHETVLPPEAVAPAPPARRRPVVRSARPDVVLPSPGRTPRASLEPTLEGVRPKKTREPSKVPGQPAVADEHGAVKGSG
ncbi:hypothetical protein C1J01_15085 [Nonomuraea aridisoli]|uniref:Uncharacterized protein n=1 Tax=Nonomuraea aridisoli TaxID=2070368 RepID=A0A2W2E7R7_9ACTN|nr:hypothetical protein C1J01_15085 [Nonomuraea aridisoli]